jgi:hypothetical protein
MPNIAGKSKSLAAVHEMMSDLHRIGLAFRGGCYWSTKIIQIGEAKSSSFGQWEIKSKEFRENLEWAVVVPGESEVSPGVALLLAELSARGVSIRRLPTKR